ncbi:phosphopyruvate hydratase [Ramlibacter sp. RBP-2]|uniref:Enolase n=1 Tax=Ramlibacter lithotrophicus TaxID=2606681 RepID=A0A7X6DJK9_9BURK|nr:phosphopyruvate hydratase [Ramlibacter lithotrophicus]NKE68223.1 phosphopyruvate hydratase [Ramlibacter lithotrophicus]
MDTAITTLHARQILDSRGRPTVEVDAWLDCGAFGRASVPSGASTGSAEAHELRDGDASRYDGLGVLKAVANVNGELAAALRGADALEQRGLDERLAAIDGTPQLARLGANAVLAVSLAVCRAAAAARGQQLYQRVAQLCGATPVLPLPMTNILSGGLHAGRGMDVQDFLAMPLRAATFGEALHLLSRVRNAASQVAQQRGLTTLLADEGGLSPGLESGAAALAMMTEAIERAGLRPGEDIGIAIDVAASTLCETTGGYRFAREGVHRSSEQVTNLLASWVRDFPVVSIEDGLDEEDWSGWSVLTQALGGKVQLVGDDLFATNPQRLARGVGAGAANGVLVKANQNGTVSGTLHVIAQARAAGYATIVSARSGETEDAFMSDLAVGSAAGQIKIGSLRTSSTVAKYNQLLRIEEHSGAAYAGTAALRGWRGHA